MDILWTRKESANAGKPEMQIRRQQAGNADKLAIRQTSRQRRQAGNADNPAYYYDLILKASYTFPEQLITYYAAFIKYFQNMYSLVLNKSL